ncbi:MAG TPA: hypothetical protein VE959_23740 [Bryobacteraceae bacterium]|nr:hypothetical protein [Bryobacteraceae bacterium]
MYLRFASKVGRASLGRPFGYYGASDTTVVRRHILIDDGADPPAVIGAVTTKVQDYVLAGQTIRVAVATYPIGLGVVEPKYAMAGVLIFRKLLESHPLNILGTGPPETNTVAKLCSMLGWRLSPVPYLFMARRIAPLAAKQLATRPALAAVARLAGRLGLLAPFEAVMHRRARRPAVKYDIDCVAGFDAELDGWWQAYAEEIGFGLIRDSRQMNTMFPATIGAFERLLFRSSGRVVGFAVLLIPKPEDARQAMGANVVTLVEFGALNAHLEDAAAALAQRLWRQRLDAVIVNHSHGKTVEALQAAGFVPRSTNMVLAVSPALQARLDAAGVGLSGMVITRADGDGPIGLGVDL